MSDPMDRVADAIRGEFERLQAALDEARRDAECHKGNAESLYTRWLDEKAIVDRIWQQLGSPRYDELAGRSIYDLIEELKAAARKRANCAGAAKSLAPDSGDGA